MSWHALGDWGTTRLRLFRVEDGRVVDRTEGPGALTGNPEAALRQALSRWKAFGAPDFISLSGMAGARTGLREAPYVDCPADVATWRQSAMSFEFDGVPVKIAGGAACRDQDGRPDVMRGEETQIFGAMALHADLSACAQTFVLPGTHTKWVATKDAALQTFRTFITGELFALLQQSSLLTQKIEPAEADEADGFNAGLTRAQSGAALTHALFEARTAQLRDDRPPAWAKGFVSGLLIGSEVHNVTTHERIARPVAIIGDPSLAALYKIALDQHGVDTRILDGDDCVLQGLRLIKC